MPITRPIILPDAEQAALIAALAKHRLTTTESNEAGEYLIFEITGHPHVTAVSYWPESDPARRWDAEWIIETSCMTYVKAGEGPTPSAAIEGLLAHIAALAPDPTP